MAASREWKIEQSGMETRKLKDETRFNAQTNVLGRRDCFSEFLSIGEGEFEHMAIVGVPASEFALECQQRKGLWEA